MAEKRLQSPHYPSISLKEAMDHVGKLCDVARASPVDRATAVRTLGYTGLTGTSTKVLSDLIQYGLLEKSGHGEVRVTSSAVEVLHPSSDSERNSAVLTAAYNPPLFRELKDRFSGVIPSEPVLRSHLTRRGFAKPAIPTVIRSYVDTIRYVAEHEQGAHSFVLSPEGDQLAGQPLEERALPLTSRDPTGTFSKPIHLPRPEDHQEPRFNMLSRDMIVLGGAVRSQKDADYVIQAMTAFKVILPREPSVSATPSEIDADEDRGE